MDLDYANVDAAKALANVIEVTESFNIQMAPMCKIRNNVYHLIKMCFNVKFEPEWWVDSCDLFTNMLNDFKKDPVNDYIF
jgi:hypothetical protein